ncbi:MAG: DNA mismatch repair protein MutS, partial [Clostridia bacterium]|nr:DNA mismatch repair protein MutS [Clostridia bacterium]
MLIDRSKLTKSMLKYVETKDKNPDALLFYQLGDFYEMFFDDAIITSKVLDLTLTGKDCGLPERAPMCGIPIHAIDNYLPKLVQAGYKVVLCNQVSEPNPKSKELVERDIVKIVTAGTLTDNLDDKRNNYIMSVAKQKEKI